MYSMAHTLLVAPFAVLWRRLRRSILESTSFKKKNRDNVRFLHRQKLFS
jgi:hypothetical protein